MRYRIISVFLAVVVILGTSGTFAQTGDKLPPINVAEYKLPNGLHVVLHHDDSTPIVAVNVWYHVGSKNEEAGKTGFAHLFEHMMFQGSKNYEDNYTKPLDDAGAGTNGTTDEDRTYYYEVVPSNFLEMALYLEADRMGGLLDAMTQEKLDNQRDVVKNERRQRVDNVPYGTSNEHIVNLMYPEGYPYHWPVIGSMEDLSAASIDDVKAFFRKYYIPNNAVLTISGKFEDADAKKWIKKYFGPIPKGADIVRPTPPAPTTNGEIRKTYEDAVPFPRLTMVWHTVPQFADDEAALDMLGSILSQGPSSRFFTSMVSQDMASRVTANNSSSEIAGLFEINATPRPDRSLADIEKEINVQLDLIKKQPPSADEISRALNGIETRSIFGLETDLGKGRALSAFAGFRGSANYFQQNLDRYARVTPADISRVANTYLNGNRLIMTYVKGAPPAANADANKPTSTNTKKKDDAKLAEEYARLPKPGPDPKFALPAITKTKLSNGLDVWIVKRTALPIVSMHLVLKSGGTLDPVDKLGISALTANMLSQGTKTRSAREISNQLQGIGAQVGANSGWDSTNVMMQTLTRNLDTALDIYSDVITDPTFPSTEFERQRRQALIQLLQRKSNATAVSDVVYNKVLYGDQVYGRQLSGTDKSIRALTRDDLANFYAENYRPNNATLIVVGDTDAKTIVPKLEKAFAGWKSGTVLPAVSVADQKMMAKPGIYIVDKPGAAQSSVSIGEVGIARTNPDFYAVQVMNAILGGGGSARLFMNLREDKGYTYGAYSRFNYRLGDGPFAASGEVQTAVTKESVIEFMKELNGIRGARPVSASELENNKQSLIRRYPSAFETNGEISNQLSNLVVFGLSDTYFNDYIRNINAVTLDDVDRVANKYLDPSKMAIVIVGDRKVIEPGLKTLGYSLTILDADGNPVAD